MSGHLDVLDPRFPIRWTLKAKIFEDLADEWDGRQTVRRVITNGARRDTVTEVTYTRALTEQTQPFRAITEIPHTEYAELGEERLEADFEPLGEHLTADLAALGGDAA